MNYTKRVFNILYGLALLLLLIVTICGLCSFNTTSAYEIVNQYGENIQIWGAGIYAHDSYFKAPIFIGSDFTILICVVPLLIVTFLGIKKVSSIEYDIRMFGILSLLLYYSARRSVFISFYKRNEDFSTDSRHCSYCCLVTRYYHIHHTRNIFGID